MLFVGDSTSFLGGAVAVWKGEIDGGRDLGLGLVGWSGFLIWISSLVVVASVMGVGSIMDGGLVEAGGPMVRVGGLMVFLVAVDTENSSFFFICIY